MQTELPRVARHEWVKSYEYIPDDEYDSKYFSRFDPDLLDAKAWVAAAKRAGMKYVVLPVKKPAVDCPVIECWMKQTNKES